MGLEYWLELVDQKHRHGSNLRKYHACWKKTVTIENFFYWLDEGEGRDVEAEECSREKLERQQVRYLSREERMQYLVTVDGQGRLCWAKDGERVTTSQDWKDSAKGIVPIGDRTLAFESGEAASHMTKEASTSGSGSDPSDSRPTAEHDYHSKEMSSVEGMDTVQSDSASGVLGRLLPKTTKKNKWIYVHSRQLALPPA